MNSQPLREVRDRCLRRVPPGRTQTPGGKDCPQQIQRIRRQIEERQIRRRGGRRVIATRRVDENIHYAEFCFDRFIRLGNVSAFRTSP